MVVLSRKFATVFLVIGSLLLVATGCGGGSNAADIQVDANGFPSDWPIAIPAGSVTDCDNGEVSQDNVFFSVVFCFGDDTDPFVASETYLATLEREGFDEREPGAFILQQQTFLDGNGIEVFYQLIGNEGTIVLIKSAG